MFPHPTRLRRSLPAALIVLIGAAFPVPSLTAPLAASMAAAQEVPVDAEVGAEVGVWDPVVQVGDAISIRIPETEGINGTYLVTQFGVVTLPRIGDLQVLGLASSTLRDRVREALALEFRTPAIEVLVLKRIRILGSVTEAGLINIDPTMTVADALALAGGRTPDAHQTRLELRRDGRTLVEDLSDGRTLSDLRPSTGDEIYVPQRSWISRNLTPVVTSLVGAATVIAVTLGGN